jgi:hypothetical protein
MGTMLPAGPLRAPDPEKPEYERRATVPTSLRRCHEHDQRFRSFVPIAGARSTHDYFCEDAEKEKEKEDTDRAHRAPPKMRPPPRPILDLVDRAHKGGHASRSPCSVVPAAGPLHLPRYQSQIPQTHDLDVRSPSRRPERPEVCSQSIS